MPPVSKWILRMRHNSVRRMRSLFIVNKIVTKEETSNKSQTNREVESFSLYNKYGVKFLHSFLYVGR